MSKNKEFVKYGNILFLIGLLIIIIGGLLNLSSEYSRIITATVFILGLAIGFLNITSTESVPFMIAGIAIVLLAQPIFGIFAQQFGLQGVGLKILGGIYAYLAALIVPAVVVVACRTFVQTAKD